MLDHEDLIDLAPGTYSVKVNDKNGCSLTESAGINQPAVLNASSTYQDVDCYANATGSIDATVTGGVLPYSYFWTGPSSFTSNLQDIISLYSGLYHLNIQNANGCDYGPMNVFINQPSLLTISAIQTSSVSCNGAQDGAINATPNGGTLPYLISWTGPSGYTSSLEDPTSLFAGSYTVTLSDDQLCTASATLSIATIADITDPIINCPGVTIVKTAVSSCLYTQSGVALNATASVNCQLSTLLYNLSGAISGSGSSLNGIQFIKGVTQVVWTATDATGNTNTCSFNITVNDSTVPTIVSCGFSGTATVQTDLGYCSYTHHGATWIPTVTDNCSGIISLSYAISGATSGTGTSSLNNVEFNYGTSYVIWTVTLSGATTAAGLTTLANVDFNLGTTTVLWTVTDGTGNT